VDAEVLGTAREVMVWWRMFGIIGSIYHVLPVCTMMLRASRSPGKWDGYG
jgi:hypothetical protein